VINCVLHLLYHVFKGISICNICNNDAVYNILYRNMLSCEQKLAYSLLCCINQTADSKLTQLLIFIHHACFHPSNHNHYSKEASTCYSVPIFLRGRFIPRQFFNALQRRNQTISQPDASTHPNMYVSCRKCL
jgi:hypothetical protein